MVTGIPESSLSPKASALDTVKFDYRQPRALGFHSFFLVTQTRMFVNEGVLTNQLENKHQMIACHGSQHSWKIL